MVQIIELDEKRQEKAKEYSLIRHKLFLVDLVIGVTYILLWIVTGLSTWWRDQTLSITTYPWLTIILFIIGFGVVFSLITTPLSYYSGFVLPRRYGLSHQTFRAWLMDRAKGLVVSGILGVVILEIIYWLLRVAPNVWWLWMSLVMLILTVVLTNLAPVLLFPIFYKFTPLNKQALTDRLLKLANQAKTQVSGVFTFNESSKSTLANAALTGLGHTRRIILADTLLENFADDEIEVVLAHELGHHVHGDLGKGIALQSALTLAGFWIASLFMNWGIAYFGYINLADPAGFPLLVLAISLYSLMTMPLGNLWSRWREVLADEYALKATQKPGAFISAMTRLANQNLADVEPPAWVEFLLHSHPAISKRVARAKAFEAGQ